MLAMSNRVAISSNKNGLFVAEGLLLRAAAGREEVRTTGLSGSVRHSKKHLAECDLIRFDRQIWVETRRLDDWCSEANLTTVDLMDGGNGLSSPVPYKPDQYTLRWGCSYADHRLDRRHAVDVGSGFERYSRGVTSYRHTLPYKRQMHTASSLQVWLAEDQSVAAFQGRAATDMERREQSSAPLARSQ